MERKKQLTVALCSAAILAQGCLPVFQQYQGARIQAPGTFEITPNVATVSLRDEEDGEGESIHIQNQVGVQVAVGVTPRLDVRASYTRVMPTFSSLNYFALGPKLSLVPDRVAVFAPFDFGFGETGDFEIDVMMDDSEEDSEKVSPSDTWSFNPAVLFSHPINERLEIGASAAVRVPLNQMDEELTDEDEELDAALLLSDETLLGFNIGMDCLGSVPGSPWIWRLRPDAGILVNPGESGFGWSFGIGVSIEKRTQ